MVTNERCRSALRMREADMTFAEIARRLGVSVERARQIIARADRGPHRAGLTSIFVIFGETVELKTSGSNRSVQGERAIARYLAEVCGRLIGAEPPARDWIFAATQGAPYYPATQAFRRY
jgi:hypothetical protein